jgi:hypothetical protein
MAMSENLQVLATLGSALTLYIFIRIGARRDISALEKRMEKVEETLDSVNTSLTRLEGRFDERGYWESRKGVIALIKNHGMKFGS